MTTTSQLRQLAVEALKGATRAGANVFAARTWATNTGKYPLLYLHTPEEDMESLGRNGAPQFTVTATLRIDARVEVKSLPNNGGAARAILELESIARQIKRALINNPALMSRLQQFPFIRTEMRDDAEGATEIAEMVMHVAMEFYQGPEEFYPLEGEEDPEDFDAAAEIAAIQPIVPLEQIGIVADLVNVADRSGTYDNPPFPEAVTPAPRDVGPDGRAEGSLLIDLPQE